MGEFIARRRFRRVYAVASRTMDYARMLERIPWGRLSHQLEEAFLCTVRAFRGSGAQQNVPRALGMALAALIDSDFDTSCIVGRTFRGLLVVCQDLLRSGPRPRIA